MLSQLAQNNYNLAQRIQNLNAVAPTQVDHFSYAMMLGGKCNGGGVNIGAMSSCTSDCGDADSAACTALYDSASYGFAQSLLAQDYAKSKHWESLYTFANLALEAESSKNDVLFLTLSTN